MRSAIRVLIVDDSALVRQMLTRALSLDPSIRIVGIAKTGVEAIERARDLEPDVITLDIQMPELDGLEALPFLKKYSRARVIVLSSADDPETTYAALSAGAVDFIPKPREGLATSLAELSELLLKKIRIAYRIDPRHVEAAVAPGAEEPEADLPRPATQHTPVGLDRVVGIAASTGGPPALERVFSGLQAGLPAAFLVVQHLPVGFSGPLARRLSSAGGVSVDEAVDGQKVEPGCGYLAPYGTHMIFAAFSDGGYRLALQDTPPLHGVRPAADPLFESMAEVLGNRAVGVVLTGMGSDGAQGLARIKAAGGQTIAQNEETSVVFGMPGAAGRAGAVRRFVPLGLVAAEIRRTLRGGTR